MDHSSSKCAFVAMVFIGCTESHSLSDRKYPSRISVTTAVENKMSSFYQTSGYAYSRAAVRPPRKPG